MPTASDHLIEADLADGVAVFKLIEQEVFRLRDVLDQGVATKYTIPLFTPEQGDFVPRKLMGSDPITRLV